LWNSNKSLLKDYDMFLYVVEMVLGVMFILSLGLAYLKRDGEGGKTLSSTLTGRVRSVVKHPSFVIFLLMVFYYILKPLVMMANESDVWKERGDSFIMYNTALFSLIFSVVADILLPLLRGLLRRKNERNESLSFLMNSDSSTVKKSFFVKCTGFGVWLFRVWNVSVWFCLCVFSNPMLMVDNKGNRNFIQTHPGYEVVHYVFGWHPYCVFFFFFIFVVILFKGVCFSNQFYLYWLRFNNLWV
jgi:hypothetical protein